jgi:hypothetical protein
MPEIDKRLAECKKAISEATTKTNLVLLKLKLVQMGLTLKTEDYQAYKNLEARIKELGNE